MSSILTSLTMENNERPVEIKGWEGDIVGLAVSVAELRYDRLSEFLLILGVDLGVQAVKKREEGKIDIAILLDASATDMRLAQDAVQKVRDIEERRVNG